MRVEGTRVIPNKIIPIKLRCSGSKKGMIYLANKNYSLAHTKWMCKYHIVFTPKYRRQEIYNQVRQDLIEIM